MYIAGTGGRAVWGVGSAAARLLRLWVRIPPGAWIFVCCECCVLSSRGLCDELITCPEESYRLWCVVMCDQENSQMRRPWSTGGGGGCSCDKKICIFFCIVGYLPCYCIMYFGEFTFRIITLRFWYIQVSFKNVYVYEPSWAQTYICSSITHTTVV